jgi:hypothetical protein
MFTLTSQKLTRAAILAGILAGAVTFIAAGVEPAMALCKYGTPHCVNPNPGPTPPKVGGEQIPGSGWVDPDCNSSELKGTARRQQTGPVNRVPGATGQARK